MSGGMEDFCGVRLGPALFKNKQKGYKEKVLESLGLNNLSTGIGCIIDRL